jgi:ArsR family transcriptional regulator
MTDPKKSTPLNEFTKAIADPTREKIMLFCCCRWRSVGEVADHIGVTQPTVSHHFAFLRRAGLVEVRPEGKQTFYRLNQVHMAACCDELKQIFAQKRRKASSSPIDLK